MPTTTTRLPLAQPLTNRNTVMAVEGGNTQAYPKFDSCMVNMFTEVQEGKVEAVKRPGSTSLGTIFSKGQGLFNLKGLSYCIAGDQIFLVSSLSTPVISLISPGLPSEPCDIISDVPINVGTPPTVSVFIVAVIKTTTRMWIFDGTILIPVLPADGYPSTPTVRGLAILDGTFYVMTTAGEIQGSALQDPRTWPALNFIGTEQNTGIPIAMCRHLNYIVGFTDRGIRLFFDAGNLPPGSPLSPVGNADFKVGSATGDCTVFLEDMTIFVGKTQQRGRAIMAIQGLSLATLSSPFVSRFLDADSLEGAFATGLKIAGHSFYILTLPNTGITLVGDVLSKDWNVWTTDSTDRETTFNAAYYLNTGTQNLIQTREAINRMTIFNMDPDVYSDAFGFIINCRIRTRLFDGNTIAKKTFNAEYLIGDTVSGTLQCRYTDDDYASYSRFLPIDMATVKKQRRNLGMSRRRAFEYLYRDPTPLRLEAVEFEVIVNN